MIVASAVRYSNQGTVVDWYMYPRAHVPSMLALSKERVGGIEGGGGRGAETSEKHKLLFLMKPCCLQLKASKQRKRLLASYGGKNNNNCFHGCSMDIDLYIYIYIYISYCEYRVLGIVANGDTSS